MDGESQHPFFVKIPVRPCLVQADQQPDEDVMAECAGDHKQMPYFMESEFSREGVGFFVNKNYAAKRVCQASQAEKNGGHETENSVNHSRQQHGHPAENDINI